MAPNWITATCTGAPVGGVAAATFVAGCGVQPGGGTNALLGSAEPIDAATGAGAIAWLGAGTDVGVGTGGGVAAATFVACSCGIQPAGGTNALLGSVGRGGATTGAGGGAIA